MTDVQVIDSPTRAETATPRRRRRTRAEGNAPAAPTRRRTRAEGSAPAAPTRRRPRLRGPELIESLRESVEQLLRENRTLKRQLKKAMAGGASAAPGAETTLRSIQRKVARAVSSEVPPRRRSRTPVTNGRRRRRSPGSASA